MCISFVNFLFFISFTFVYLHCQSQTTWTQHTDKMSGNMAATKFTLTGQATINGYNEQVYLVKSDNERGFAFKAFDFTEDDLIAFSSREEAFAFGEKNNQDLAEVISVEEVF